MSASFTTLQHRATIIQAIRLFFYARDFLEVETPYLVESPGMEPHLDAFETTFHSDMSGRSAPKHLYLPTSPEFHMKRLLSRGCQKIFQISRAFRNGETGDLHQPEFTMIEWYRAHEQYEVIMEDVEALLFSIAMKLYGEPKIQRQSRTIDLCLPWERLSVKNAWLKFTGIDPFQCSSVESLRSAGRAIGVNHLQSDDPWDVLYFKIFLDRIEPNLGRDKPVFLYEYPADMAALARLKPGDESVALRFEVYIDGIEIGNAFDELTDPVIQRERCEEARNIQIQNGKTPFPVDESFLEALGSGMPASAGIAMGVDRIIMILLNCASIQEVVAFPFRP